MEGKKITDSDDREQVCAHKEGGNREQNIPAGELTSMEGNGGQVEGVDIKTEGATDDQEIIEETKEQKDEIALLKEVLQEREEEKEEYLRLLQRTKADFENYRRRIEKERLEIIRRANESLFLQLLPVLDNLERALEVEEGSSDDPFMEGVKLIYRQFLAVLAKEGVKPIQAEGEPFDPELHEAVLQVGDTEAAENTVVEELQKGYMLHDRVLRPSMVKVAKG